MITINNSHQENCTYEFHKQLIRFDKDMLFCMCQKWEN